jgi:hypothetical protein
MPVLRKSRRRLLLVGGFLPAPAPIREDRKTRWFLLSAILFVLVLGIACAAVLLLVWLRKANAKAPRER